MSNTPSAQSFGFVTKHREPAVVMTYGDSGIGKTVSDVYGFPCGFFVAGRGALKPAVGVVGYVPQNDEGRINNIEELITLLPLIAAGGLQFRDGFSIRAPLGGWDAIVVDDFSLLAKKTAQMYLARYASSGNRYAPWQALSSILLRFRDTARECALHVVMNGHALPPGTDDGVFHRGGPDLPGRQAPRDFPLVCDMVLHMVPEPTRQWGWKAVYRCSVEETSWFTKDRHNVTPDKAPANIGEILRFAGYSIRRAPGLEWMDEVIDAAIGATGQHVTLDDAFKRQIAPWLLSTYLSKFLTPTAIKIVEWVERDAHDRLTLKLAQAEKFARYGFTTQTVGRGKETPANGSQQPSSLVTGVGADATSTTRG